MVRAIGMNRMPGGSLAAMAVMLFVYGGYFLLTYEVGKKNVIGDV